jgi:hypothetical protein
MLDLEKSVFTDGWMIDRALGSVQLSASHHRSDVSLAQMLSHCCTRGCTLQRQTGGAVPTWPSRGLRRAWQADMDVVSEELARKAPIDVLDELRGKAEAVRQCGCSPSYTVRTRLVG